MKNLIRNIVNGKHVSLGCKITNNFEEKIEDYLKFKDILNQFIADYPDYNNKTNLYSIKTTIDGALVKIISDDVFVSVEIKDFKLYEYSAVSDLIIISEFMTDIIQTEKKNINKVGRLKTSMDQLKQVLLENKAPKLDLLDIKLPEKTSVDEQL